MYFLRYNLSNTNNYMVKDMPKKLFNQCFNNCKENEEEVQTTRNRSKNILSNFDKELEEYKKNLEYTIEVDEMIKQFDNITDIYLKQFKDNNIKELTKKYNIKSSLTQDNSATYQMYKQ